MPADRNFNMFAPQQGRVEPYRAPARRPTKIARPISATPAIPKFYTADDIAQLLEEEAAKAQRAREAAHRRARIADRIQQKRNVRYGEYAGSVAALELLSMMSPHRHMEIYLAQQEVFRTQQAYLSAMQRSEPQERPRTSDDVVGGTDKVRYMVTRLLWVTEDEGVALGGTGCREVEVEVESTKAEMIQHFINEYILQGGSLSVFM